LTKLAIAREYATAEDRNVMAPQAVQNSSTVTTKHCPRCDADVPVDAPWPHWRKIKIVYVTSLVLLLVVGPIMAVDYCVMIPSAILYLGAWGPINGHASERPTCRVCGGIVP
jgi:hypothetical protein